MTTTRDPIQLSEILKKFRAEMGLTPVAAVPVGPTQAPVGPVAVEVKAAEKKTLTMREVVTNAMTVDAAHRFRGATGDLFPLSKLARPTRKWDASIPILRNSRVPKFNRMKLSEFRKEAKTAMAPIANFDLAKHGMLVAGGAPSNILMRLIPIAD